MIDPTMATPIQRRVREASRQAGIPLFLRSEVAAELGVTATTLKRWAAMWPECRPSHPFAVTAKLTVHLYTTDNVAACEVAQRCQGPRGNPAKWTPEQRAERQRLASMRSYYRRAARLHRAEGDEQSEAAAEAKVRGYQESIDSMVPRGVGATDARDVP